MKHQRTTKREDPIKVVTLPEKIHEKDFFLEDRKKSQNSQF